MSNYNDIRTLDAAHIARELNLSLGEALLIKCLVMGTRLADSVIETRGSSQLRGIWEHTWGPAGCFDLGGGKYAFFGWASS